MEAPSQPLQVEEYGVPAVAGASLEPPPNHLELAQQMALAAQDAAATLQAYPPGAEAAGLHPSMPGAAEEGIDLEPQAKRAKLSGFASKQRHTSTHRGVSWHTQTQRWKAQIKVNGKDVNLGRHKEEELAARAYDRAALCARGVAEAKLNYPLEDYQNELEQLQATLLEDLAAQLRGVEQRMQAQTSRYHGVRQNKRTKKWEAYIRVLAKHVHLGCHDCEIAAAQAYDQAAIVRHAHSIGPTGAKPAQLVTNFPPEYYQELLQQLVGGNSGVLVPAGQNMIGDSCFYQLDEKFVNNLLEKCKEATGGDMGRVSVDTALQVPAQQVMQQMGMSADLHGPPLQQLQHGQEHLQEGMLGGSAAPKEEQHDGAPAPTAEACVLPVINSQLAALANINPAGPPVQ